MCMLCIALIEIAHRRTYVCVYNDFDYDQISAESKAIFVIFNQAQVHASTQLFASERASKGSSRNLQNQKGSCYLK